MLATITPDGSLVISLPEGSVFLDAVQRTICVRARPGSDTPRTRGWDSLPFDQTEFVSLLSAERTHVGFQLARRDGEKLDLGFVPVGEISRQIARALETISGRRLATRASTPPYHEQRTRRLIYPPPSKAPALPDANRLIEDLYLDIEVVLEGDGTSPTAPEAVAHGDADPTVPIDLEVRFEHRGPSST